MSDQIRRLAGARDAPIDQINEIIRGATIKRITPKIALDDSDGQVLRIELNGGDFILVSAAPVTLARLDGVRATIHVALVSPRQTRLKL